MAESIIVDSDEPISVHAGEADRPHFYLRKEMFGTKTFRRKGKRRFCSKDHQNLFNEVRQANPKTTDAWSVAPLKDCPDCSKAKRKVCSDEHRKVFSDVLKANERAENAWMTEPRLKDCPDCVLVPRETVFEMVHPHYTVNEVGKFFFGRTAHWVRWRNRPSEHGDFPEGFFVVDGQLIEPQVTPSGFKVYDLAQIERIAHALAQNGGLTGEQLLKVVKLCIAEAAVWGVEVEDAEAQ
jgi:hypothetical protein